jgi:SAM-dependent methyltransferase
MARRLGLERAEFHLADARRLRLEGPFAAAYVLDVLHHVRHEEQRPILIGLRDLLAPGGALIVKDVTTRPAWKRRFTLAMDRLVVGRGPICYRHHSEWQEELGELGFDVRPVPVFDVLPYPHVLLVCRKR